MPNMTEKLKPTLLPCPFCGKDACVIEHEDVGLLIYYYIICNYCHATTKELTELKTAIKAWNRRAK